MPASRSTQIVNHSVLQTFGRSINTSLTVILTLTALLLFGGASIRYFVLALLIGIVSRDVLVDLQRQPAPRRVARTGRTAAAARSPAARPARRAAS